VAILELRILPPLAIARLGSSPEPLEAFDLLPPDDSPLGYRVIAPQPTFIVDEATGEIVKEYTPERVSFKDGAGRVRPAAPFLEVFARTSDDEDALVSLTPDLLERHGSSLGALSWTVAVSNIKIFRRTGQDGDKIVARLGPITSHERLPLSGHCENFLPGRVLPLGSVQFIKPSILHPEVRLRFTPATGAVYGTNRLRHVTKTQQEPDPIINHDDLVLYDEHKGRWRGYKDGTGPTVTNPPAIYAGYADGDDQVSWGYLDDECDGHVRVALKLTDGRELTAHGHIGAGPPRFAPDSLPLRTVSDELEQILLGSTVEESEYTLEDAADLVRRGLESVRLLNTTVMNGNPVDGRPSVASMMPQQDADNFGRYYAPIAAESLVDNLALRTLHERAFGALLSGTAPWFPDLMRRPEEIGDLSAQARRKMPAMMRGADGRALTFTRRQIDLVVKAASGLLASAGTSKKGQP
jgi:hypothetical protein